jgi:uncharacterized protein YbjQ (UPF0145 family)
MIIATTNEISGYEIGEVFGEVFGMVGEAESKGANAIVAMRFDASDIGGAWTEICAYGTAVRVKKT